MLCMGSSGLTKALGAGVGSAKILPGIWGFCPSHSQQTKIVPDKYNIFSSRKWLLSQQAPALLGDGTLTRRQVCGFESQLTLTSWLCDLEQVM